MAGQRTLLPLAAAVVLAGLPGCFLSNETSRSGSVGDTLEADDLEATVVRVDRRPPVPRKDITGLSQPRSGFGLVGVLVKVCSGYGAAIGAFDFELESSAGDGRQKYPHSNYRRKFETIRDECGEGWIVYEIPSDSKPTKIRFDFSDSGNNRDSRDNLEARFEWRVE